MTALLYPTLHPLFKENLIQYRDERHSHYRFDHSGNHNSCPGDYWNTDDPTCYGDICGGADGN